MSRITLAIPPFAHFGYLPFSISALKAFVESQSDDFSCTGVDLNIRYTMNLQEKPFLDTLMACLFEHDIHFLLDRREAWVNRVYEDHPAYADGIRSLKDPETYRNMDIFQTYRGLVRRFQGKIQGRFSTVIHELAENLCLNKRMRIPDTLAAVFASDLARIQEESPDLVGLYLFCPTQMAYALLFAQFLKQNMDVPVFGVGSLFGKNDPRKLLETFSCLDGIIVGGAEHGLGDAARWVPEGRYENISGLAFFKDGDFVINAPRYVEDINTLPYPDPTDFSPEAYPFPFPVMPLQFSRGCYWNRCAFCARVDELVDRDRYATKTTERCLAELSYFADRGFRHFLFVDDAISPGRLKQLSDAILEKGLDIRFCFAARSEKAFTEPLLRRIRQAGGQVWFVGVESFSQGVIDAMNKGTVVSETVQVLKNAHVAGLFNVIFLIHGFPVPGLQDPALEKEIIDDLGCAVDDIRIFLFTLSAGSPILQHQETYGIRNARPIPQFQKAPDLVCLGWKFDGYDAARKDYLRFRNEVRGAFETRSELFVNGFVDPGHLLALCEYGGANPVPEGSE